MSMLLYLWLIEIAICSFPFSNYQRQAYGSLLANKLENVLVKILIREFVIIYYKAKEPL